MCRVAVYGYSLLWLGQVVETLEKPVVANKPGGESWPRVQGHVAFDNVSFQYPTRDVPVFKGMSLELPRGALHCCCCCCCGLASSVWLTWLWLLACRQGDCRGWAKWQWQVDVGEADSALLQCQ